MHTPPLTYIHIRDHITPFMYILLLYSSFLYLFLSHVMTLYFVLFSSFILSISTNFINILSLALIIYRNNTLLPKWKIVYVWESSRLCQTSQPKKDIKHKLLTTTTVWDLFVCVCMSLWKKPGSCSLKSGRALEIHTQTCFFREQKGFVS